MSVVDPAVALATFGLVAVLAAVLFWPGKGMVARARRWAATTDRVLLEDALKYLHTCERRGRPGTVEGLAGTVEVRQARAAELLGGLVQGGLAESGPEGPGLTNAGREAAIQTVRIHRLWERWLADRTGVRAEEWHDEAERMEHALSPADADLLSARLGHPRFDPHGDPIPTRDGRLPPRDGMPLSAAPDGRVVRVVHLEDEPPAVYRRLLERGLAPGLTAAVENRGEDGVRLRAADGPVTVDPVAAGHVTVTVMSPDATVEGRTVTLDRAGPGRTVRVAGIAPALHGPQRRRLLDMGLVRGTEVTPELVSASGDPVAYRIRGALVALRREQARQVQVEPIADTPARLESAS